MPGSNRYVFNPACSCRWCANGGVVPQGTGDNGHAFGYENPHIPPADPKPVRVIALLSWYDEDPAWLERCIRSLPQVGVSGVLALDGAYSMYPDAHARSHEDQVDAIRRASAAVGLPVTVEQPDQPWAGEVEKRNRLFEMAESSNADWYMVVDADEFVTAAPNDVLDRLAASVFDVGAVTLREPGHPMGTMIFPTHPKFFRAIPGIRAVLNHFTYTAPDGRKLWGNAKTDRLEPRTDLTDVVVEHHKELRHPDRRKAAKTYYQDRDLAGVEELPEHRPLLQDAA